MGARWQGWLCCPSASRVGWPPWPCSAAASPAFPDVNTCAAPACSLLRPPCTTPSLWPLSTALALCGPLAAPGSREQALGPGTNSKSGDSHPACCSLRHHLRCRWPSVLRRCAAMPPKDSSHLDFIVPTLQRPGQQCRQLRHPQLQDRHHCQRAAGRQAREGAPCLLGPLPPRAA